MRDRIATAWHLHRKLVIVSGAMFTGLLVVLVATATVIRLSGSSSHPNAAGVHTEPPRSLTTHEPSGTAYASDVADWNAKPAIAPAASTVYPAVPPTRRSDPAAYASAFATEMFTRSYATSSRDQLLAWVQYENAPLRSARYPEADWTKVLVDSLTDPSWDEATDTAIPSEAVWQALANQHTEAQVSAVAARVDPQWEQKVTGGYDPTDHLMTVWDVTFRLTQRGDARSRHSYDVSLALQLGTSPRGLYGVAATNNYVIREVN